MNVKLIASTDCGNVLDFIGSIAGICYGKEDPSAKRALRCAENGHASIFEHVSFTFMVNGISRACSHQLVRHRLASFTQESQRYEQVDTNTNWYVNPGIDETIFDTISRWYKKCLDCGMPAEDARNQLPNATCTHIVVTMNLRELCHFMKLRNSKHAQWEIRDLSQNMWAAVVKKHPELDGLVIRE